LEVEALVEPQNPTKEPKAQTAGFLPFQQLLLLAVVAGVTAVLVYQAVLVVDQEAVLVVFMVESLKLVAQVIPHL
jgi:hypothetical protein